MKRNLIIIPGLLAVCRLDPKADIPSWATGQCLVSVTRTDDELSIVCPQDAVPVDVRCERNWRCLRVAGTMDFSLVGVLASLTAPLAAAGISVFAISTFDTDYLLVKSENWQNALAALRQHGHAIADA